MIKQFNYSYYIDYEYVDTFEWTQRNEIVGFQSYENKIMPSIEDVVKKLNKDKSSRQAIIVVNDKNHNSCLISLQYQIQSKSLYVSANYRSQHIQLGKPHDIILINYVSGDIISKIKYNITDVYTKVNVGNYHGF